MGWISNEKFKSQTESEIYFISRQVEALLTAKLIIVTHPFSLRKIFEIKNKKSFSLHFARCVAQQTTDSNNSRKKFFPALNKLIIQINHWKIISYRSGTDEVEKSLELLDKVLSEFEEEQENSPAGEPESPSQGHQSEDDGYMSMNGRR